MSADEQGYNGWTNYETWAVGLYLDGNYTGEGTYLDVLDIVARESRCYDLADESERSDATCAVADALKDYVDEQLGEDTDDLPNGLATDLLRAALSEVNWRELAESKLAAFCR